MHSNIPKKNPRAQSKKPDLAVAVIHEEKNEQPKHNELDMQFKELNAKHNELDMQLKELNAKLDELQEEKRKISSDKAAHARSMDEGRAKYLKKQAETETKDEALFNAEEAYAKKMQQTEENRIIKKLMLSPDSKLREEGRQRQIEYMRKYKPEEYEKYLEEKMAGEEQLLKPGKASASDPAPPANTHGRSSKTDGTPKTSLNIHAEIYHPAAAGIFSDIVPTTETSRNPEREKDRHQQHSRKHLNK
jgi:outer membrane murein-binding lipoprotein Lpp